MPTFRIIVWQRNLAGFECATGAMVNSPTCPSHSWAFYSPTNDAEKWELSLAHSTVSTIAFQFEASTKFSRKKIMILSLQSIARERRDCTSRERKWKCQTRDFFGKLARFFATRLSERASGFGSPPARNSTFPGTFASVEKRTKKQVCIFRRCHLDK